MGMGYRGEGHWLWVWGIEGRGIGDGVRYRGEGHW